MEHMTQMARDRYSQFPLATVHYYDLIIVGPAKSATRNKKRQQDRGETTPSQATLPYPTVVGGFYLIPLYYFL